MPASRAAQPVRQRPREWQTSAHPQNRQRHVSEASRERRRRELHLRARRRDLLQDGVAGLLLFLAVLIATPGLGVVALLEGVIVLALAAFVAIRTLIRRRRARVARPPQRRARSYMR
ncbi:MAG TPA: hypothetical protein VNR66_04475 [Solirubrobacteraceae bacterium]|nr:hypothetical protein [Solirubrobacteraceae bacterium]